MDYREGEKEINDLTACRGNRSPDFDAPVDLGFELVVALVKIVFRDVARADIGACNVLKHITFVDTTWTWVVVAEIGDFTGKCAAKDEEREDIS
jgi:hypothetical protein